MFPLFSHIGNSRSGPHAPTLHRLPRSEAGQHSARRERPCSHIRSRAGLRLLEEETTRIGRHTWLHGSGGSVEGNAI